MDHVTIIGNGHMARSIAVRTFHARHSVQVQGPNSEITQALVEG